MNALAPFASRAIATALCAALSIPATAQSTATRPPNGGRGAGTVPVWNPFVVRPDNPPLTLRVLVLNYDPVVAAEGHRHLSQALGFHDPHELASRFVEAMEYATGGYLRHEIVEWRNIDGFYWQEGGHLPTVDEYVRNRRTNSGWRDQIHADYPRLIADQNIAPRVDAGEIDEVWIFADHYFGLWEASMAGPGAFFVNGGVYPDVPTRRPFVFYGFNYERGVAEMMHDASHRTEATLNRVFGPWNLKAPRNLWDKFSANESQSKGQAGVGTCHWPANAEKDYDYGNPRVVASWADGYLAYPDVDLRPHRVSRDTWSKGPDYHLDYMKWYFAHLPRCAGIGKDSRRHNWLAYVFDFQSHDALGVVRPSTATLLPSDVLDPTATSHPLEVCFQSAWQVDPESLGTDDVEVTTKDGAPCRVVAVTGNEPIWVGDRVVRYTIEAPIAGWQSIAAPLTVQLRANAVRTRNGEAFVAGPLGTFTTIAARDDGAPIEWPKAPLQPGSRTPLRAQAAPPLVWRSSAPEVASVERGGVLRAHRPGTATITARRGTAVTERVVTVADVGQPTARLVDAVDGKVGDAIATLHVEFTGRAALRKETVATGCVRVRGPNGYHAFPVVTAAADAADGRRVTARIDVAARAGAFAADDVGEFEIELLGFAVGDAEGRFAAPARLGSLRIATR